MVNEEYVNILKRGVEVWNKWRKEHPNIRLDLRGADLRGAKLRVAQLFHADLSHANLTDADLFRAYLRKDMAREVREYFIPDFYSLEGP